MTKVVSRYFESMEKALKARHELIYVRNFSQKIVHLLDKGDELIENLTGFGVDSATAEAYSKRVASSGAVLLVQAGHRPLCVAQTTRDVLRAMGAENFEDLIEEVEVKKVEKYSLSVLRDHPHMLTRPRDPHAKNYHMANWPIPLISRRRPYSEALFPIHSRMANWPIPLISRRKPFIGSIFSRHARMANWPIPLLSKRAPYDKTIFARHARMANFPIPLISHRKPFNGTLIGKHTRMANWPFPLLINGKTGTNAIMPGGPRMANFPIPLLSKRKPFDVSAFPRHARMANFLIPLISRRKPFSDSAFPRHARMADVLLPLTVKGPSSSNEKKHKEFSLSKLLGIPTIIRR